MFKCNKRQATLKSFLFKKVRRIETVSVSDSGSDSDDNDVEDDIESDTDSNNGAVVEPENMDSQPSFNLDKDSHQSVSVSSDPETESSSQSTNSLCVAECCSGNKPYQPQINYSSLSKRKQGKCCRSFQSSWYNSFKWLSYCMTHNKVFCYYCRIATASRLVSFSKRNNDAFVSVGFDNWKKVLKRFREHELCHMHTESYMKLKSLQKKSIANQLCNLKVTEQKCNREMLYKVLSSLKYLLRQGLPIRGHCEESGNLIQLLQCRSEDIDDLKKWISRRKYLSHEIINEQIEIMAHHLLRELLVNIQAAEYFALIGDETRDISGKEQFAISIRWVSHNYVINEDLITLAEVDQTDGATLTTTLKNVLICNGLQISKCYGQTYDGASNMSGHLNGVAARIQKEQPKAHYVHCVAHSLNLCLQDCGQNCITVREALTVTIELASIIRASPKRLAQFRHLQEELSPGSPGLKPLCPTRWTVRTEALHTVIMNYSVLRSELEKIGEESYGEASRKSLGILAIMEKFTTFFGLKLSFLIFSAMEQLSKTLQYKDINAQEVSTAVNAAKRFLERQRDDLAFKSFYSSVVEEARELTSEPMLPRQRHIPRRVNDGAPNHNFQSPEDFFRQQYFEVLDLLVSEITQRFNQPTFSILQEMERMIIDSCNGKTHAISSNFEGLYADCLDIPKLKTQLSLLPDVLKTGNADYEMGIKKVTTISTICQLFETCKFPKTMLSEVHKILQLYLTIPLSSATAERAFSTLRRLKSYLRSTMTQRRLNHVILLNTYKEQVDKICIHDIAKEFVSRNERRIDFFGNI